MKKILTSILCIVFTSCIYGQTLEIEQNAKTGNPELLKKTKFDVSLINDTQASITIFYSHYKEYGGSEFSWETKLDGEQINKGSMHGPMDTNSRFKKNSFITIAPGQKKKITTLDLEPEVAGTYELSYSIVQDPKTVDTRYAENKAAKKAASKLSKLNISKSASFEVKDKAVTSFAAKDITFEELSKEKMHKDFTDAAFDPSSIYRMTLTIKDIKEAEENLHKIAELKNLRELKLSVKNSSEFKIPAAIGEIPLMKLSISGKTVNVVFPDNFLKKSSLRSLNLSKINQPLDWIGNHTNLESLYLNYCGLQTIPDWIEKLTELETLSVSNNEITSIPAAMDKLSNLKTFQIENNKLTELKNIFNNVNLKQLIFGNNQIKTIPEEIGNLTELTKLRANNNLLSSIPSSTGKLMALAELWLENNQITAFPPEVTQLQKLTTFYFNDNQVTILPEGISNMTALRSLSLINNQVKEVPAEILDMKKIPNVFVKGNPMDKGHLEKMKKVMKRQIIF